ncbi:MAG TPA: ATP-binding protein [Gaiellaceae bacterium]|nr:ATP-binding protein [Gaiellaceae bacterium]
MTVSLELRARPGVLGVVRRGLGSIAGRLVLASAAFALLVAIAFALLVASVDDLRGATEREARAKNVTVGVLAAEKLVVDLESGVRGYAITGDRRFLRPYTEGRKRMPGVLDDLRELTAQDPAAKQLGGQLAAQIAQYADEYAAPVVLIARDNQEAAQSSDSFQVGRQRVDAIRRQFETLLDVVNAQARASADSSSDRARQAVAIGVGGFVLSGLLVALLGLYLVHSIGRPLRAAATGASKIAEGDFAQRLPERGPGEVRELSQTFNRMAAQLAARERELEAQNAALRASEQLKSELVSIVSHEVRTPLASVLGFTSLLLQRDVPEDEQRRYLEIIDAQGKRLAALLDDFLDVQRIEEGRLELARARVDLAALLREQVQLYEALSADHALALTLPTGPFVVEGDADRLAQVIGNLLSNAIKYSPEGGSVEVVGDRNGDHVRVSVRDHGLGIPEGQHGRIFTKFFRGDAAASGIAGTGLGLAFARAVVEAHGGAIGFRSAPGKGSTFWVELPVGNGR